MKKPIMYVVVLFILCAIGYGGFKVINDKKTETASTATGKAIHTKQQETVQETKQKNNTDTETKVDPNKVWDFSFYKPIDISSLSEKNAYVLDENGNRVNAEINLSADRQQIIVNPPQGGYDQGSYYELHFEKDITYTDGQKVDKPHVLTFTTNRPEVETAKLNPNLKVVEDKDIVSASEVSVKLSSQYKKSIKKGDILILKTESDPEGTAVKIVSVSQDNGNKDLKIEAPSFYELFERLDINKTYEITEENFEPAEGVEAQEIAQIEPNTQIASLGSPSVKYEYKKGRSAELQTSKTGIELKLNSLKIGKSNMKISGDISLYKPKVDLDFDTKFLKVKKAQFITTSRIESNLLINNQFKRKEKQEKTEEEITKELIREIQGPKKEKGKFEKPLGKFNLPLPIAGGITLSGDVLLQGQVSYNGEVQVEVKFKQTNQKGIIYKNGKNKKVNDEDGDLDVAAKGNGSLAASFGPSMSFRIKAFKIVGAGVEASAKVKADGSIVGGVYTDKKYALLCGKIEGKLLGASNLTLGVSPMSKRNITLATWKISENEFFKHNFNIGQCERSLSVEVNPVNLRLKAGQQKPVTVNETYFDVMKFKTKNKIFGLKQVKVKSSDKETVTTEKSNDNVLVLAKKVPATDRAKVNITVTKGNLKGEELAVPVLITNYSEIQKQKEKEKAEKESAAANASNWEGEWTRPEKFDWAVMKISDVKGDTFKFDIQAYFIQTVEQALNGGIKTSTISGIAKIDGNVALQVKDGEYGPNCQLKFTRNGNNISIDGTIDCQSGVSVGYDGNYKKGYIEPPTYSENDIGTNEDSNEEDSAQDNTTGEDEVQEGEHEDTPEDSNEDVLLTPEQAEQLVREYLKLPADSNLTVAAQGGIDEEGAYFVRVYEYSQEEDQEKFYGNYSVGERTGEVIDLSNDAY